MFLLREFFKSFIFSKKRRIGFVLSVLPTPYYGKIMASARLRAYDIINIFRKDSDYFLELYKPWKKYDIVIFQKKHDGKAFRLAQKLKKKSTKVILDINVNYYDKSALAKKDVGEDEKITRFTEISDGIITSSSYIENYVKKSYPQKKITFIPENITDNFFSFEKNVEKNKAPLKLMYVGYSDKAKEVLIIEKTLQKLRKIYNFNLLFICNKDPEIKIPGIDSEYIKYKQKIIPKKILEGDIFIAPRNLSNSYNLGHSFTKIGYPLSVGIPVIASRVPSYENSPALLCDSENDWENNLKKTMKSADFRQELGEKGIKYCRDNFSEKITKERYLKFFLTIIPNNIR